MAESNDRAAIEAAKTAVSATHRWRAENGYKTSDYDDDAIAMLLTEMERLEKRFAELSDGMSVAAELLDRLADDAECMVDHEGCNKFCLPDHRDLCLEHSEVLPCPHPLARGLVGAWREVQKAADS